ncbi:MAG: hypothetical protein MJ187_04520 [Alphaproteobacteria bacterium]|nr:hypothetical protein [Alphaproteobacteria bacterium]
MNKKTLYLICGILLGITFIHSLHSLLAPYAYDQIMRFIICGVCIIDIFQSLKHSKLDLISCLIAVLYNPIFALPFINGEIWLIIKIATIIYFIYKMLKSK